MAEKYTIAEIIERYELPILIRKPSWFGSFYFIIEEIDGNVAKGKAIRNGRVYTPLSGKEYSYRLYEEVELYGDNKLKYDDDGYDADGYDEYGYDRDGYDEYGYDEDGYDEDGYDVEGYDREGVHGETGYIKGTTTLFAKIDGSWEKCIFEYFEYKDDKELIYISFNGKRKFFSYPSEYVKESRRDIPRENSKKFRNSKIDVSAIKKAFKNQPLGRPTSDDKNEELDYEKSYHKIVDESLSNNMVVSRENLYSGNLNRELSVDWLINPYDSEFSIYEKTGDATYLNEMRLHFQMTEIRKSQMKPYFARIDCGSGKNDLHTVYLGYHDIDNLVVDWRNKKYGNAYYYSDIVSNENGITLALKRLIDITEGRFIDFEDEINLYTGIVPDANAIAQNVTDSMFIKLLEESRKDESIHDIVKTIQQNQYDIITSDFDEHALINGCAGSGKTMMLYHRLSYMAYNEGESFRPENVYAITPTELFLTSAEGLIEQLQLDKINNSTYLGTLNNIINKYQKSHPIYLTSVSKNNEAGESSKEWLSVDKYQEFVDVISNTISEPYEFYEWFLKEINRDLTKYGVEEVSEGEFYKYLLMNKDLSALIDSKIRSSRFTIESRRVVKDRRSQSETVVESRFIPREISYYSIQNFDITFDDNEEKKNIINKFRPAMELLLSKKTKIDDNGIEKVRQQYFPNEKTLGASLALLNCERILRDFQKFHNDREVYEGIFLFLCKYACIEMCGNQYTETICAAYTLRLLVDKYEEISDERTVFFIDEFQNYSEFEIETLETAFSNYIFNFYGDYSQKLEDKGIDEDYFYDRFEGEEFEIIENYRNAFEITEYINEKLDMHMLPIGLHGSVEEVPIDRCKYKVLGRTAIIMKSIDDELIEKIRANTKGEINLVTSSNRTLEPSKLNVLSVFDSRGLEFETVFVIDSNMSKNEKYVAYTRSLNNLTIVH